MIPFKIVQEVTVNKTKTRGKRLQTGKEEMKPSFFFNRWHAQLCKILERIDPKHSSIISSQMRWESFKWVYNAQLLLQCGGLAHASVCLYVYLYIKKQKRRHDKRGKDLKKDRKQNEWMTAYMQ